jgi:hypothetical protein
MTTCQGAQKCSDLVDVKLEWAGSGMPLACDMTSHDCQVFLIDHNHNQDVRLLAKRVRDLQKAVYDCIDMHDLLTAAVTPAMNILADCTKRCLSKVKVFLGHSGPELTLAPWFLENNSLDFMNLSKQTYLDHWQVWNRASSEYAAFTKACKQTSNSTSNSTCNSTSNSCFVLAVSLYDDVACAVAYVHSMPCMGYRLLRKDLQHDKKVILYALKTRALSIQDIAELCNSSVFRRNKDVLLAGGCCYFALQYACTELRNDSAFVRQMMHKNKRAIRFASPSLLQASFVEEFFEDMTCATLETLFYRGQSLQSDKQFMLKVLRRWPHLFTFAAHELQYDIDIVCTAWKGVIGTELTEDLQKQLSPSNNASQCIVHNLMTVARGCSYLHYFCSADPKYRRSDSNRRIQLHEIKDVEDLPEEYYPNVHHHEIVMCTTSKRSCTFCDTPFDVFERHYRCAAWCEWYSCTTCAENLTA